MQLYNNRDTQCPLRVTIDIEICHLWREIRIEYKLYYSSAEGISLRGQRRVYAAACGRLNI